MPWRCRAGRVGSARWRAHQLPCELQRVVVVQPAEYWSCEVVGKKNLGRHEAQGKTCTNVGRKSPRGYRARLIECRHRAARAAPRGSTRPSHAAHDKITILPRWVYILDMDLRVTQRVRTPGGILMPQPRLARPSPTYP